MEEEAAAIERAVTATIEAGIRTPDIAGKGLTQVTTGEFGSAVAERVSNI
ncbi:MAG: isocitrate/isopropylmalate family dehydrogenase [Thermocrispum sp.]